MKVIFLGNSEISVNALRALYNSNEIEVVAVVTNVDKKVGRNHNNLVPSPVAEYANSNNIKLIKTNSINKDIDLIKDIKCDYLITCSFGSYLSKEVLELPDIEPLNIHTSILPKCRGGAPIHWAIIRGEKETGYSVMKMIDEMDAGDYYSQVKISIDEKDTYDSLYLKLSNLIEENIVKQLLDIFNNKLFSVKQEKEKVTFSFNVKKEDQVIDFKNNSKDIFNKIRGLNSKPGSIALINDIELKVWDSMISLSEEQDDFEMGEIIRIDKNGIKIKTRDSFILLKEITIPGKKKQKVEQVINGKLPFKEGEIFK